MKSTTKALLLGTTLFVTAGSTIAFGGPGGRFGGPGNCDMRGGPQKSNLMRGFNQIGDLSSEQRDQLQDLRRAQRDVMRSQRDAMQTNHVAMQDALEDGADSATIEKLAQQRGASVAAMTIQRAEMKRKVDAILTEEQRETLADISFGSMNHFPRGGHGRW
jgi:Spy/CpxP family protein refolding chaperone